ncbi:hypothetical protein [Advenella mimigardefordensis]|uniref:Uncharacterized protein n=1 Tax=Advenella mimigardefordensis (strain DSM 17166 / LMG 22922 / DPN7) TaxID=1247726 RepID=W0PFX1_ADVMD|nr:hypothetical protein [Advenella mimigardefordensis]AHG65586.1 hypothetical protein MIM_c35260 [Advenella mimigardefordensis DPN7]
MKNVGFKGGSSMFEVGTPAEMEEFFNYLRGKLVSREDLEILDRLYRKYIAYDDLDKVSQLVSSLRSNPALMLDKKYLKNLDAIEHCIESAKVFYKNWGEYVPLKVGVTDVPYYIDDERLPLELYDALTNDDPPFWLR